MTMKLEDMVQLIGNKIRVNREGPDSIEGLLTAVHTDFLELRTKDELIYVNSEHIKSITTLGESVQQISNFLALLNSLKMKKVQINRGGPEKVSGQLIDINEDFVLLQGKDERLHIQLFHIKSITVALQDGGGKTENEQKNSGQKNGNAKNSKQKNNKNAKEKNSSKAARSQKSGKAKTQQRQKLRAGLR